MEPLTLNESTQSQSSLIWSNISVLCHKKKPLTADQDSHKLLNNVSGIARSGEILAIVGASGVGKTTLMRVLSGRLPGQLQITGKVYLNGQQTSQVERAHTGFIGHVEQEELFIETMTLEEQLIFQAMLRMPDKIPDDERIARVNQIISQLVLTKSKSTIIGQLSGGEKKRLAFATALLTNPYILLIDEPTSGLDIYLAKSLMHIIRSMAIKRNQTIVVILHQPTNIMFDLIDQLCLIVEGGRQGFFGNKNQALEFFTNQCQLSSSSLDGFIEQLVAPPDIVDNDGINAQEAAANQFTKSGQTQSLELTIKHHLESIDNNDLTNKLEEMGRSTFPRQLKWLLWRLLVSGKRSPKRTTKLIIRLLVMALIAGFTFFHLSRESVDYIEKVNALLAIVFMSLLESNMSLMLVEIPTERILVIWEHRRQLYSIGAYYLSRLIVDTVYHMITSIIYMGIILLLAGLSHWILLIGVMILTVMTACSFASVIAALSSTSQTALLSLQPIQNIFANFSGFFINLQSIPIYLRWIKHISYFFYSYNLFLLIQWQNVDINVSCNDLVSNSTLFRRKTCDVKGNDILKCFDVSYQNYGYYIIRLVFFFVAFHLVAFFIVVFRIRHAL